MANVDRMFGQGASAPPPPQAPPPGYPGDNNNAYPPSYDAEAARASEDVTLGTSDTSVKLGFLRKVYGTLTLCLAVTVAISCAFSFILPIRQFVVANYWLLFVGLVVGFGSYIALVCIKLKKPLNAIMLGVFVLGFSLMIGVICARYFEAGWGKVVIQAFAATVCIFVSLTAYVLITKKDFSYLGGFLLGAIIALVVISLITFFSGLFLGNTARRWLYFAVSVFGALIYTLFILYDTSLILHRYGPDDWIQGVVDLYVDCKLFVAPSSSLLCSLTSFLFLLLCFQSRNCSCTSSTSSRASNKRCAYAYKLFTYRLSHLSGLFYNFAQLVSILYYGAIQYINLYVSNSHGVEYMRMYEIYK